MAHHTFNKKEALLFGWHTFKKNWKFLVLVFLIAAILQALPTNFRSAPGEQLTPNDIILSLVGIVVQGLVTIGTIVISLKFVDHKTPELSDLVKHYRFLARYLLVLIFFILLTLLGGLTGPLVIVLIPFAIYFAIRLQFYSYFIVDRDMGPIEALKASYKITKGHVVNLLLLGLIFAGVMILGVVALLVGILVAWPVISLATAYVYRKLAAHH